MKVAAQPPLVAVVILNWNGLQDTCECLVSLQKIDYADYKVVVVDNGSHNNEAKTLQTMFVGYADVIANGQNLGYAGGVNIGIKYAMDKYSPDYYLLLNNDTTVDPRFLSMLVAELEKDATAGVAGPKVYYYDRRDVIQSIGAYVNMYSGEASYPGLNEKDRGQYDMVRKVDWVGPCVLIKSAVIGTTGYFDEDYFAYWEDVDFCARAGRDGFKTIYVPASLIWHKLGGAVGGASPRMYYFMARNRIRFMQKNAGKFQYACFITYLTIYNIWAASAYLLLTGRKTQLKAFWRGLRDGFRRKTGDAPPL